jgi:hypothetical protein
LFGCCAARWWPAGRSRPTPEFLEVDFLGALRNLGPEGGYSRARAAARDVIGPLCCLGQREEGLRFRPGVVDQRGVDAMVGDHRKAEAFERSAEIMRELVGGKRHRNNGNGSSHANIVHMFRGGARLARMSHDLGVAAEPLKGKRRFRRAALG